MSKDVSETSQTTESLISDLRNLSEAEGDIAAQAADRLKKLHTVATAAYELTVYSYYTPDDEGGITAWVHADMLLALSEQLANLP